MDGREERAPAGLIVAASDEYFFGPPVVFSLALDPECAAPRADEL